LGSRFNASSLAYDAADDVWQGSWTLPAGSYEYKAALNGSWNENYGLHGGSNGANVPLNLGAPRAVKFYYDHTSHWVTDNVQSVIAVAPGSFQSEMGCPGDWDPSCLRSWLEDRDGDGIYTFDTTAIPPGFYEAKAAINETWDENYGQGGVPGGANISFTVGSFGEKVRFRYVAATHVLTISGNPTCEMGAGTPVAGEPNKNVGTIKIGPGLTAAASTKNVTLKVSGTLENCRDMDGVASKFPISGGAMKMQVQVPQGAMCSALISGAPLKTKLTLEWKGINPASGKLAGAAPTDTTTLSSVSETASSLRAFGAASSPFAGKKSVFAGKHAVVEIVADEDAATVAAACAAKGGLTVLHFTGVNGASTVEIQP
jgi:hypothetical protein